MAQINESFVDNENKSLNGQNNNLTDNSKGKNDDVKVLLLWNNCIHNVTNGRGREGRISSADYYPIVLCHCL